MWRIRVKVYHGISPNCPENSHQTSLQWLLWLLLWYVTIAMVSNVLDFLPIILLETLHQERRLSTNSHVNYIIGFSFQPLWSQLVTNLQLHAKLFQYAQGIPYYIYNKFQKLDYHDKCLLFFFKIDLLRMSILVNMETKSRIVVLCRDA